MQRRSVFSALPGYNFNSQISRANFAVPQVFGKIHDGVYYMVERASLQDNDRYPTSNTPPWLAFDGQRLMFKAYFEESVEDGWKNTKQIRVVNMSFFLEDGTMKIVEPAISKSGLEQGVLVRRQRIPIADPVKYRFFDIIDLNIGRQPEIFGRVYKIVNCDMFTRRFLNRMGIAVPDPIEIPTDCCSDNRQKSSKAALKTNIQRVDTLGKFLKFDRKILKFYGYWDDSETEYGSIHDLEIRYHLSDDTMEIKEILPPNSARDINSTFLKRMKIPKFFSSIEPIGAHDPFTVLNVLGDSTEQSYFIADPLNTGKLRNEYYKDSDLSIGARINVFGREIVIIDLDSATKEYYSTKYGIETFKSLERPRTKDHYDCLINEKYKPPPYNGFGSYDDSLGNCFRIVPKPMKPNFIRFFQFDKQADNNNILRFRAKMLSKIPEDTINRDFIINFYLMDNTISIYEVAFRNTGFQQQLFQKRMKIPIKYLLINDKKSPRFYEASDFFIGTSVCLGKFIFQITWADEYTLRYMERNHDKFIRSNLTIIMKKIRQCIKPVFKQFIDQYKPINKIHSTLIITFEKFRQALFEYLQDNIVEHEIITVARNFSVKSHPERDIKNNIRKLIHTELRRFLWDDLQRLQEGINHWDPAGSRFLPTTQVYTILRGAKLPVDAKLIDIMLSQCIKTNNEGKIDCKDLIEFLDLKINPVKPIAPIALKSLLLLLSADETNDITCLGVDWTKFLNYLNIKNDDPVLAIENA